MAHAPQRNWTTGRRNFMKGALAAVAGASFAPALANAEVRNGMPYRPLGKTGEMVSLLCLGGFHIGRTRNEDGPLSEQDNIAIIRRAIDEGVNFLDNAWEYHQGRSEENMGKALKDGYRDKVLLMTKVMGRDTATAQEQLETSLRRLDVETIDLWQFHAVLYSEEAQRIYNEGAIEVALKAQKEGKVRYIGFTGHHYPSVLQEMIDGGFPFDAMQMPLNVLDHHFRSFENDVLPTAVEKEIGVIAMKTMGGLPGQIPNVAQAAKPEECLRYAMSLPVATVCSGMSSMAHLEHNLEVAKNFKPYEKGELAELLARTEGFVKDGDNEPYKTKWHPPQQA